MSPCGRLESHHLAAPDVGTDRRALRPKMSTTLRTTETSKTTSHPCPMFNLAPMGGRRGLRVPDRDWRTRPIQPERAFKTVPMNPREARPWSESEASVADTPLSMAARGRGRPNSQDFSNSPPFSGRAASQPYLQQSSPEMWRDCDMRSKHAKRLGRTGGARREPSIGPVSPKRSTRIVAGFRAHPRQPDYDMRSITPHTDEEMRHA